MADDKLSGKASIDTTEFKTGIAAMNREMRVLESGFKASAASLADWSKDATGLESRIKSLTSEMDIQRKKVEVTRAEYERMKAEYGENSRAAQEMEIRLNGEVETLGKMDNKLRVAEGSLEELRNGSDDAGNEVEDLGTQTEETGSKMESFKSILSGLGAAVKTSVAVIAGLAASVVAVGTAITALVFSSADAAGQLVDLSAKTGISTTQLQELSYISDQVGTSLDTITSSQARLIRSMASAKDGSQTQVDAFKALGVSVVDANGNLRNQQDVFKETIDALGQIQNPAEADALAMELFGKNAQELNPLIKAGSAELSRLADQAHQVGAVMDEETVAGLEAFDDTLASLQAGLKGTLGTLAGAFLPGFQAVFDQLGGYLKEFADVVKNSDGDFGKMAEGLTGIITKMVADIGAQAPAFLQAGLTIIQSILTAILSALPGLLTAGINIVTSLIDFLVQNLPMLVDAAVQIITALVQGILPQLPRLVDAALQIIVTLANGITAMLPTLLPVITEILVQIVQVLIDNLPMLVDAALQLMMALAQGLIQALPILTAAIPVLVDNLIKTILQSLPQWATTAGQLVGALATGIVAAIPIILNALTDMLSRAYTTLYNSGFKWKDIGKDFIRGLIDGIQTAGGWLYDAVASVAENMLSTIRGIFGIASPSKKGRAYGRNLFESQALGAMDALPNVTQAFTFITTQLAKAAAGQFSNLGTLAPSMSTAVQNDQFQFFAPVVIQGDTTSGSLAAKLKTRLY